MNRFITIVKLNDFVDLEYSKPIRDSYSQPWSLHHMQKLIATNIFDKTITIKTFFEEITMNFKFF